MHRLSLVDLWGCVIFFLESLFIFSIFCFRWWLKGSAVLMTFWPTTIRCYLKSQSWDWITDEWCKLARMNWSSIFYQSNFSCDLLYISIFLISFHQIFAMWKNYPLNWDVWQRNPLTCKYNKINFTLQQFLGKPFIVS